MSIIVSGIRLPFDQSAEEACRLALNRCGLQSEAVSADIFKTSIDRRHSRIDRVYSVRIDGYAKESALCESLADPSIRLKEETVLNFHRGKTALPHRPAIVGFGPAGLFAAYLLAREGYQPIVFERGDAIETRDRAVSDFWKNGILDPDSNIQFGEGGAGAYSDGKLTTRINDPLCDEVLRIFVKHGMPADSALLAKPHVGTDILKDIVRSMRQQIIAWGGEVRFRTRVDGILTTNSKISALRINGSAHPVSCAVFAIGHSARDTFFALAESGVYFEPKPFSVGVRIEHLQSELDRALYGKYAGHPLLPAGEYALSHRENGRACYSFCMCPGGHVVAAQSEPHTIVTNGMSYHARNGVNSNAALAVSVDPTDFSDGTPFGGIAFQRHLEGIAYQKTGSYRAPCQLVGDFLNGTRSQKFGSVHPTYPMDTVFLPLEDFLPSFVTNGLRIGLGVFARKLPIFRSTDAVMTGPETRTSSPVRMKRTDDLQSLTVPGFFPCGEGAGYAGGIMSAAVDGLRVAGKIIETYQSK